MSELNTERSKTILQRGVRLLLYIFGISLACFFLVLFVDSRPRYIEVEIDLPGENDWDYTEKTVRVWSDKPQFFILRRETNVYKHSPYNFSTTEEVIEYIDSQLIESGWKNVYFEGLFPCDPIMPESNFLEWGKTYRAYKEKNWVYYQQGTPTLCLAVWPIENYDGFHVVIMTENPSFLTEWRY